MPRIEDRRPTIRLGERPAKSKTTDSILHNNTREYLIPGIRVILDEEALLFPTSTLRPHWRNYEKPPELRRSAIERRKLTKTREIDTVKQFSRRIHEKERVTRKKRQKKRERRSQFTSTQPPTGRAAPFVSCDSESGECKRLHGRGRERPKWSHISISSSSAAGGDAISGYTGRISRKHKWSIYRSEWRGQKSNSSTTSNPDEATSRCRGL